MHDTLELAQHLICRPSITPADAGCQRVMMDRLEAVGFQVERLGFEEVENFWARRGDQDPLFVFAGHTDVVPPGPLDQWHSDPFLPEIRDGFLYGRGAADMKGSLAAMVTACERFITARPDHHGSIGFLITSDEEGPAQNGTAKVMEHLQARNEAITWCLVGEPSSSKALGDVIKNGRRGSLHGRLVLKGIEGHVAYPDQVQNPIHATGLILAALADEVWDKGNDFFPPTSFQISNIHSGTGAVNVVPGEVEMLFNFRFSTETTVEQLTERVQCIIDTQLLNEEVKRGHVFAYDLTWHLSGIPFLTPPGELVAAAIAAVRGETSREPVLSTSGGTSDARFIAPTGAQVMELGPVNATIHKTNERVLAEDLDRLSRIYEGILIELLG
jgi:succinyl-diaminopimelate desuccinylase